MVGSTVFKKTNRRVNEAKWRAAGGGRRTGSRLGAEQLRPAVRRTSKSTSTTDTSKSTSKSTSTTDAGADRKLEEIRGKKTTADGTVLYLAHWQVSILTVTLNPKP